MALFRWIAFNKAFIPSLSIGLSKRTIKPGTQWQGKDRVLLISSLANGPFILIKAATPSAPFFWMLFANRNASDYYGVLSQVKEGQCLPSSFSAYSVRFRRKTSTRLEAPSSLILFPTWTISIPQVSITRRDQYRRGQGLVRWNSLEEHRQENGIDHHRSHILN